MENVKFEIKGTILTITADLSKNSGPSKSGKTTIIATTSGNVTLPGADSAIKVGLNIYKKS